MRRELLLAFLVLAGCSRQQPAGAIYPEAWTAFRQGHLAKAQELVEAGLKNRPAEAPELLPLRLLLSEILLGEWRAHDAKELLDQIPPESGALHLRWLVDQAEAASKLGRNDQSLAWLDQADRAPIAAPGEDSVFRASLLRGAILARTGQMRAAEDLLAKTAARAASAGDSFNQSAAFLNLSLCKMNEDRYDESLEYSRPALELAEKVHAGRLASLANENLGVAYAELGDLDRAEQYHNRAVQELREVGDLRDLAESMGGLGNIYLSRHEPSQALDPFQQAVQIASGIYDNEDAGHWAGRLSSAYAGSGDWNQAESWNQKARRLYQEAGVAQQPLFLMQNDAEIAVGRGKLPEAERTYRDLVQSAKADDPVQELDAHMHLGELLASQGRFPAANAEYAQGLTDIERTVTNLIHDDYRLTYYDLQNEFFKEYVDLMVSQKQEIQALKVAEYSRARVLAQKLGLHASAVNQIETASFQEYSRRTGAVLLSYWLAPKRSFVWVVRPDGIRMHTLPAESEISDLVRQYRKIIEDDLRDPVGEELPQADKLSQMLIEPILSDVAGAQQVVVVPDGALHALNLETLPAPGTKHYWIEDTEIAIAPALSLLSEPPRRSSAKASLLLIGAPSPASPEYPALPAAASEIANIQQSYMGAEVHTGADATPASFLNSNPARFSLIHFAAHAEANPASPLESAVILSQNQQHDGYKLYARDIANEKLSADLVTLSGCRSAGARAYGGEGLVGFAWAFLESGAHAVIAGLWEVSDQRSSTLMGHLYEALVSGATPQKALRQAKLAMLRSGGAGRKPFYWAPYQTYIR